MPTSQPARRRIRSPIVAVLVLGALLSVVGWRSLGSLASSAAAPVITGLARHHPIGVADGKIPAGVTVFDDSYPAVTKLDPALLRALRAAATDAARDGVRFYVNSGWRSKAYQEELFDEAIAQYGSAAKAARWVARPGTSVHEAGDAADIGPDAAAAWLARHGAAYGLCQIYANERWHFELRPGAAAHGCPAMYVDPTQDPRLR